MFLSFARQYFPITGLSGGVSAVCATLFSSYWTFRGCFCCFHDTFFQLLDFLGSFLPFSRHCFPITGLFGGVSAVFKTPFSSFWTPALVSTIYATPFSSFWAPRVRFHHFHDTFLQSFMTHSNTPKLHCTQAFIDLYFKRIVH